MRDAERVEQTLVLRVGDGMKCKRRSGIRGILCREECEGTSQVSHAWLEIGGQQEGTGNTNDVVGIKLLRLDVG